jgi:hypothetical protein
MLLLTDMIQKAEVGKSFLNLVSTILNEFASRFFFIGSAADVSIS